MWIISGSIVGNVTGSAEQSDSLHRVWCESQKPASAGVREAMCPTRGQAATRAAMVLSGLLARADATNRELAQAYDRARLAGDQCATEYDGLMN